MSKINQIFGTRGLNRTPTETFKCPATYLPDPSQTVTQLSDREESEVRSVLNRMLGYVKSRRVEVLQQFQNYDRAPHRNYITRAHFCQSLLRLGLTTSEKEMELLSKAFRCTDLDEVNYSAFVREIGGYLDFREQQMQN